MKKIGLLLAGGVAAIVLLTQVGPIIGLGISLFVLYFAFKQFIKADRTGKKVFWGILGALGLLASISHLPALLGVVALYVLYMIYKKWNKDKRDHNDPFTNFEKQWAEMKRN
jgi:lia operon protein LiaI